MLPLQPLPSLKYIIMLKTLHRQGARHLQSFSRAPLAARSYSAVAKEPFNWKDPLNANNLFTEEELAIAETAESYCQERMLPRVLGLSLVLSLLT